MTEHECTYRADGLEVRVVIPPLGGRPILTYIEQQSCSGWLSPDRPCANARAVVLEDAPPEYVPDAEPYQPRHARPQPLGHQGGPYVHPHSCTCPFCGGPPLAGV